METAKGVLVGSTKRDAQRFVCGFRDAFYITALKFNFAYSNLLVCVDETGLFTLRAGHVFIYVRSMSANIVNHIRRWMTNVKGSWLTSARDSAESAQKTLTIHLKIIGWPKSKYTSVLK